jgi:hypothetical protein
VRPVTAAALLCTLFLAGCWSEWFPPDPGEEGKATLAGVDTDEDGVRDDVERHIVSENRDLPGVIPPLLNYAALKQRALLHYDRTSQPPDDYLQEMLRMRGCIKRVAPETGGDRILAMTDAVTNTEERWLTQLHISKAALGGRIVSPEPVGESECEDMAVPPLAPKETATQALSSLTDSFEQE